MTVSNRWFIYLTDKDLKEESKEKDITYITCYDFKPLSDIYANKAYYIEYEGKKGKLVLKNKNTLEVGLVTK